MISAKMTAAISKQVNAELYSSYLYLSMANYLHSVNLAGSAHWMQVQSGEEYGHAMKLYKHVIERGGTVDLESIAKPETKWASPKAVFNAVLKHEQKVTGLVNGLAKLAADTQDFASANMLQYFVNEQVEEEATASQIVAKLDMIGDSKQGLLMLDYELKNRQ